VNCVYKYLKGTVHTIFITLHCRDS